jgi:haloalkane dehalogenase
MFKNGFGSSEAPVAGLADAAAADDGAQLSRRVWLAGSGPMLIAASSGALAQAPAPPAAAPASPSPGKAKAPAIPAAFPYESHYAEVLGSRMHYVEVGTGAPIVLLHGIPTSSYLWRNTIPFMAGSGRRVIALDNLGFGRSDKPAGVAFGWLELARHLEGFVQALNLRDVTFVMHDLGGALGLDYAWRNPANVRGLAYLEAALPPAYPRASFASFGPSEALFRRLRDPIQGRRMLMEENWWVETFLPASSIRDLEPEEMAAYRAPFATVEARRPIYDMVQSLPIEGQPVAEWAAFAEMVSWWRTAPQPKLVMYGSPGRVTPRAGADWALANLKNVETAWVGPGIHYIQEDSPEGVGRAVSEWFRRRFEKPA